MNITDCMAGLRVKYHHDGEWKFGVVTEVGKRPPSAGNTAAERAQLSTHDAKVRPEGGDGEITLQIKNLRHAPPFYGVRLTVPSHMVSKLVMEGGQLVLEIDASGTYHAGHVHPFNVISLPPPAEGQEVAGKHVGLYVNTELGGVSVSRPDPQM